MEVLTCKHRNVIYFIMSREDFNPHANIEALPEELVRELNLSSDIENQVLEVFSKGGGTLNVSEVLVGFYKIHEEAKTRRYMISTLYRMRKKGFLRPTGKKGEYTVEMESEESDS